MSTDGGVFELNFNKSNQEISVYMQDIHKIHEKIERAIK
jgi:hypothetical protein